MYRIILFILVSFLFTSCKDRERNTNRDIMEMENNRVSREKKTILKGTLVLIEVGLI